MIFKKTPISGAYRIRLEKFGDDRGTFARAWCKKKFAEQGIDIDMVQANIGYSRHKNTLRGMHVQLGTHSEGKLVRCTKGAVWDVILDLRKESDSYKQWMGVELREGDSEMFFLPPGCAHGYQTLKDHTEIFYMVSEYYAPESERGIRWNDPEFQIEWKKFNETPTLSDKDKAWPDYSESEIDFKSENE